MELHTKSDFTALARKILNPLLPLYSAGGARLHLGDTGVTYPARTIEMEAFSRPLWALGPLWAGGGRADTRRFEAGRAGGGGRLPRGGYRGAVSLTGGRCRPPE